MKPDDQFNAWVQRTADNLSADAARLYQRALDDMIEVDDVLGPDEDELVMAGLVSHVRAAGSREYYLEPEPHSKWSLAVLRILQERYPLKEGGE